MDFATALPEPKEQVVTDDDRFTMEAPLFKPYEEPKAQSKPKPAAKKVLLADKVDIVKDDTVLPDDFDIDTPDSVTPDATIGDDMGDIDVPDIDTPVVVDFVHIENVPVYPGCEKKKGNTAKRKCMSDKIKKLVQKKFNGGIASEYGLSGLQRIDVQFQIDKTGKVTQIKTRAPHPKLEDEALRVIKKIPEMQPGMQRNEPVGVRYTLPIMFKVQ